MEHYAAKLEAQQAIRDFNEQHKVVAGKYTAEDDFLMWRLGGYAQAAERAAIELLPY